MSAPRCGGQDENPLKSSKQRRTNCHQKVRNSAHELERAVQSNEATAQTRNQRRTAYWGEQRRSELDGVEIGQYIEKLWTVDGGMKLWYRAQLLHRSMEGGAHRRHMYEVRWLDDSTTSIVDLTSKEVVILGSFATPPSSIRTKEEARNLHAKLMAADDIDAKERTMKKMKRESTDKSQDETRGVVAGFLAACADLCEALKTVPLSDTEKATVISAMTPLYEVLDPSQFKGKAAEEEARVITDRPAILIQAKEENPVPVEPPTEYIAEMNYTNCDTDSTMMGSVSVDPPTDDESDLNTGSLLRATLHALADATALVTEAETALQGYFISAGRTTPAQFSLVSEQIDAIDDANDKRKKEPDFKAGEGTFLAGLRMKSEGVAEWGTIFDALSEFASRAGLILRFPTTQRMRWQRACIFSSEEPRITPTSSALRAERNQLNFLKGPMIWKSFFEEVSSSYSPETKVGVNGRTSTDSVTCLALGLVTRLLDFRVVDGSIRHISSKLIRLPRSTLRELSPYMISLGKVSISQGLVESLEKRQALGPFPHLNEKSAIASTRVFVDNIGAQVEADRLEMTVWHEGATSYKDLSSSTFALMDEVASLVGGPNSEVPMWQSGLEDPSSLFATPMCDELITSCLVHTLVAVNNAFPRGQPRGDIAPSHIQETISELKIPPPGVSIGDEFYAQFDIGGGLVGEPEKRGDYSMNAEPPQMNGAAVCVVCFRFESRRVVRCTSPLCIFETNAFTCNWVCLCRHALHHVARLTHKRNVGVATDLEWTDIEANVVSDDPPLYESRARQASEYKKYDTDSDSAWKVNGIVPHPWINRNFAYKHSIIALLHMAEERGSSIPLEFLDRRIDGQLVSFLLSDGAPIRVYHNLMRALRNSMETIAQNQGRGPGAYGKTMKPIVIGSPEARSDNDPDNCIDLVGESVSAEEAACSEAPHLLEQSGTVGFFKPPTEADVDVSSVPLSIPDLQVLSQGRIRGGAGGFHKYQQLEQKARSMETEDLMERSKKRRPGGDGHRAFGANCGNLNVSRREGEADTAGLLVFFTEWFEDVNPDVAGAQIKAVDVVSFIYAKALEYKSLQQSVQAMEGRLAAYLQHKGMRTFNKEVQIMVGKISNETDYGLNADTYGRLRQYEQVENRLEPVNIRVARALSEHVDLGACSMPADEFLENTNKQKAVITTQNKQAFHADAHVKSGNAHESGPVASLGSKRPGPGYPAAGNLAVNGRSVAYSAQWYRERHPKDLREDGKFRTTNGDVYSGLKPISYTGLPLSKAQQDIATFGRAVQADRWVSEVLDDNGKSPRARLPRPGVTPAASKKSNLRHQLGAGAYTKKQLQLAYPRSTPSLKPVIVARIEHYQKNDARPVQTKQGSESYNEAYDRKASTDDPWDVLFEQTLLWRVNNKEFVMQADQGASNGETDLMDSSLRSLYTSMDKEPDIHTRREKALAGLINRVSKIGGAMLNTEVPLDCGGMYNSNETLPESVCRLLSYVHGPDDFDGANWPFGDDSQVSVEGEWGETACLELSHPRFGGTFTDTLEAAASALSSVCHVAPKPGRLGGCQREVKSSHKKAMINRNIQLDLGRLKRQVQGSVDEAGSVWHKKWPYPAAIEGQRRAAEKLARERAPIIERERAAAASLVVERAAEEALRKAAAEGRARALLAESTAAARSAATTAKENTRLESLPPRNRERRMAELGKLLRGGIDLIVNTYNDGRTKNRIQKTVQKKKRTRSELTASILDLHADRPGSPSQRPLHRHVVKAVHARSGPLTRDSNSGIAKKGEYTYEVECFSKDKVSCQEVKMSEYSEPEVALFRAFDMKCANGQVPKTSKNRWSLK